MTKERIPTRLSDDERRRLRTAHDWCAANGDRYDAACREVDLDPKRFAAFLRVLKEARERNRPINVLKEVPAIMYAAAWSDSVVKIGITLREKRVRGTLEARIAEHEQYKGRPPDLPVVWWPGSREREKRLLKALGKNDRRPEGREWYRLTDRTIRKIVNYSGEDLSAFQAFVEP